MWPLLAFWGQQPYGAVLLFHVDGSTGRNMATGQRCGKRVLLASMHGAQRRQDRLEFSSCRPGAPRKLPSCVWRPIGNGRPATGRPVSLQLGYRVLTTMRVAAKRWQAGIAAGMMAKGKGVGRGAGRDATGRPPGKTSRRAGG